MQTVYQRINHSEPSGTRSSPNINWKLCKAGFQWWILPHFLEACVTAEYSDICAA